jgi:hypothetical protein
MTEGTAISERSTPIVIKRPRRVTAIAAGNKRPINNASRGLLVVT